MKCIECKTEVVHYYGNQFCKKCSKIFYEGRRMDLQKLFETQKKLDEKIITEKGLQGQDLLDKKILALQVELGELANELPEVFKFWSGKKNNYEKALKEYVDGLHFVLSIGNDLGYNDITEEWISEQGDHSEETTTDTFILLLVHVADVYKCKESYRQYMYESLFLAFIALGLSERHLGFTWKEIEQAYYDKNKINHERQVNGY